MEIRHILFDLDGTLLPMIQEKFVRFYMPLLAKTYISRGGGSWSQKILSLRCGADTRRW